MLLGIGGGIGEVGRDRMFLGEVGPDHYPLGINCSQEDRAAVERQATSPGAVLA